MKYRKPLCASDMKSCICSHSPEGSPHQIWTRSLADPRAGVSHASFYWYLVSVIVHLCVCWETVLTRDTPIQSGVRCGWEFTRKPGPRQGIWQTLPPSVRPSASCLFIYPLKADWSCFHDQAEWILSLVPLPCQRVYGLLCQRVTSSSCWQLLCCSSEARIHRTNRKNAQTAVNECGDLLPRVPFWFWSFEDAPGLKGQRAELNTVMCTIHGAQPIITIWGGLYHLQTKWSLLITWLLSFDQ